jgi:Cu2+-exporting ATPase/Cu+-exporting ATPase
LERGQQHPVARAIVNFLNSKVVTAAPIENLAQIPRGGIEGVSLGSRYSIRPLSMSTDADESAQLRSKIGVFRDELLLAEFELGDKAKAESKEVLTRLRSMGYLTYVVSGDREPVVKACARALDFSIEQTHSQVTPEEKAALVREAAAGTVMIGDGANDAAAFATADVGIAVSGSLDVSMKAADIYLTRPNLAALVDVLSVAEKTKRAIQRNLFFSVSFNVLSGALAIMGFMTPLWAAVLMPLSSLTVLTSAVWTGRRLYRSETSR